MQPAAAEPTTDSSKSAFSGAQFTFKPASTSSTPPAFPAFPTPASAEMPTKAAAGEGAEEVDAAVATRLAFLSELSEEHKQLVEQYTQERVALENKFQQLMLPLYEKRADVVNGRLEVTKDAEGKLVTSDGFSEGSGARGVPAFWRTILNNNRMLAQFVAVEDLPALEHLTDIKCIEHEDQKGFKLEFHFSPNEWFTNSVLTKDYVIPNMMDGGEPQLETCTGTAIEWRPGKNLTVEEKKMKPKGKKRGPPIIKQVPKDSFFNFFTAVTMPDEDTEEDEEYEELMQRLEVDYTIAALLKEEVIPNAVQWFTGEAEQSDDEDEDEDEDDEEGDDDEDESDDDEEEVVMRRPARRGGRRGRAVEDSDEEDEPSANTNTGVAGFQNAGGQGQGEQQECKQS